MKNHRGDVMTLPVVVEQANGHFTASLAAVSGVSVSAPTREAALAALQTEISRKRRAGELVLLPVEPLGVTDLAGVWEDHPFLDEMVAEIYRQRDAELPPE